MSANVKDFVLETIDQILGCDPGETKIESNFRTDLGFDSLDFVELAIAAEEEYDISLSDEAAERIETVGEFVKYIDSLVIAR